MSKRKGAAGEREAAAALNQVLGAHLRRGRQYHGGPESPDLAGDVPGLHVEVKRCERLRLYEAMRQACRDAAVDQVPAVMHRANNRPWLIVVQVDDLIRLLDVVDECRVKLAEASEQLAVGSGSSERVAALPAADSQVPTGAERQLQTADCQLPTAAGV